MFQKRRSYFFLILILLSVGLAALIVWQAHPSGDERVRETRDGRQTEVSTAEDIHRITNAEYEEALQAIVRDLMRQFDVEGSVADQRVYAEHALSSVLDQRVPAAYQETHLRLAFSLNALVSAINTADQEDIASARNQLIEFIDSISWIQS